MGSRALGALVSKAVPVAFEPSLMTRFGPSGIVANFSTFFVLLPVALAFIAIGIPFALRTIAAAMRRELEHREFGGLAAVVGCVCGLVIEARGGGSGLVSFCALTALAYWQLWPALKERGRRPADWLLIVAGAAALSVAYYAWKFLGGAQESQFVAPTFLVVAFYAAVSGIALVLPPVFSRPRTGPISAIILISAVLLWLGAPQARALAVGAEDAETLELAISSVAAAIMLVGGALSRLRARP